MKIEKGKYYYYAFSFLPVKVIKVEEKTATLEGGGIVPIGTLSKLNKYEKKD